MTRKGKLTLHDNKQKRLREIIEEIWEVEQTLDEDSYERNALFQSRIQIMDAISELNK